MSSGSRERHGASQRQANPLLLLQFADGREFESRSPSQTAVEIEVEVHFRGNDGTEFRNKKSDALLAISEVVASRGAKFAVLNSLLADAPAEALLQTQDEATRAALRAASPNGGDKAA